MFHFDTRWIWLKTKEEKDEYASFVEKYHTNGEKVILRIAAESNYIAYVNGTRVGYGQFPNYKKEKYYDEIDITEASFAGENELRIVVWYEGINSLTHIQDRAGVIFEVQEGERILCHSSENTLGGLDTGYQQHVCRLVTWQLGYSVNMCSGGSIQYDTCREADLSYRFHKRPVKKLIEEPLAHGIKLNIPGKEIYDFGRETVGYMVLQVQCEKDCEIILAYGEHLLDGCVRQIVGERDFSMHFQCRAGVNSFEQLFLRMAGRYVEIFKPESAKVECLAILPAMYPLKEKEMHLTGLDKQIYDVSVRTLRLCMHEHYEDCPWREQALYVLDARNQMLCGYDAFDNAEYARENIVYISKGTREDGLLELTYPAVNTPAIPFFSLMYPVMVWEYVKHTKDQTILQEVMPVMKGIMEKMKEMLDSTQLLRSLPAPYWNFYEWTKGSDSADSVGDPVVGCADNQHDLILNCAFVYASHRYLELCGMCGESFDVDLEAMKKAIKAYFYNEEKGMYFLSDCSTDLYSQLGNAFAKLIGLEGTKLEQAVKGECGVVPATLSMAAFVYDALLDGKEENERFVLEDIRKNYGYMLNQGATSFWETLRGASGYDRSGSLCHGWSAIPVHYYHKLLKTMQK